MSSPSFQRIGAAHNAGVGRAFEALVHARLLEQGTVLAPNFAVPVGVSWKSKVHRFDFGSSDPPVLVECKSHTWTNGGNIPNAKLTVWNEAMYYFHVAPRVFRKIFFVLRDERRGTSLASYYLRTYEHLVPDDVEVWEYDTETHVDTKLR